MGWRGGGAEKGRGQPICSIGVVALTHTLDGIFYGGYIHAMKWEVEYTDEFGQWWAGLSELE
jgi:hypothetical protein